MDAVWSFLWYYVRILFLTIGVFVMCGLAVAGCEALVRRLLGGGLGYRLVIATSLVGTPVHEIGHALMCLLFGHRISRMVLWQPRSPDGVLGYVTHTYRKRNPYQVLGNLFIGIGPIFSGLGMILLLLFLCYPDALRTYLAQTGSAVAAGEVLASLGARGWRLFCALFTENSVHPALRVLTVTVILCTCLHINLSVSDIRGSLGAFPLYLLLVFLFALPTFLFGEALCAEILYGLGVYTAVAASLFFIVFVFSAVLVGGAFVFFCLRKLFARR